jgi:hypothetical protein
MRRPTSALRQSAAAQILCKDGAVPASRRGGMGYCGRTQAAGDGARRSHVTDGARCGGLREGARMLGQ